MSSEVLPHTVEPHPVTGMFNGKFGVWLFLASEVMLFGGLFSAYVLMRMGDPHWMTGRQAGLSSWIGMINTLVLITSSVTMVMSWAGFKVHDFAKGRRYLAATIALALTFLVIKLAFEYIPKFEHYGIWLKGHAAPITGHVQSQSEEEVIFHPDAVQLQSAAGEHAAHNGTDAHAANGNAAGATHAEPAAGGHGEAMHIRKADIQRMSPFTPRYNNFYAIYYTITGLHGLHILGGVLVLGYLLLPGAGMWRTDPERYTNRIECTGLYWHFVDLVWIFLFPLFYLL